VLSRPFRVEAVPPGGGEPRFLGYAGNVSTTGVFIQSLRPRPPGTQLELRIYLTEPFRAEVACTGEVVWAREHAAAGRPAPGMGIQFVRVPTASLDTLARLCQPEC
jgi:uncharacterized protein (TIGR02266 family)